MFFASWQLWEEMTFVLGVAILLVFAIAYGKLLYTNRLLRKQEVVDEERRMRIRELRSSGQIVDSRKDYDIPFGVRAIQSGIQVDGIWISQSNTPTPSNLKLDQLREVSTEMTTIDLGKESQPSSETISDTLRPLSKQGRPPQSTEASEMGSSPTGTRASYKPRRSSHLRNGSYGQFDEDTLSQLEGTSPASRKKVQAHRPRPSRQFETEADSSAADNERSSVGASSDSETSLSPKFNEHVGSTYQSILDEPNVRNATSSKFANIPSGKAPRGSTAASGSKIEYFSIPRNSSQFEPANPFETPSISPDEGSRTPKAEDSPLLRNFEPPQEHQPMPPQSYRPQSPFVPGELHVNKSVRKVNSGFEVLPAGTFGVPPEFKGNGLEMNDEDDSGDRRQSKLQKKQRTSMTGRRISSTLERPEKRL